MHPSGQFERNKIREKCFVFFFFDLMFLRFFLSKIGVLAHGTYLDRSGMVDLPGICWSELQKKNSRPQNDHFHFKLNFRTSENRHFFLEPGFLKEKQSFFHFHHHSPSSLPIGFLEPQNSSNFQFPRNPRFSKKIKSQTSFFLLEKHPFFHIHHHSIHFPWRHLKIG